MSSMKTNFTLLFMSVLITLITSSCAAPPVNVLANEVKASPEWETPERLPSPVNSDAWEDGPSIYPDGTAIYFTRGRDRDVKSYVSRITPAGWSSPVPLEINIETFPTGAPHTQDDRTLYFSSIRPGTTGLGDIYAAKYKNGKWTEVENLGDAINTKDMESEPYISPDGNTLYFASNRKGGKGKADIWFAEKTDRGWSKPVNVSSPVNTDGEETQPFMTHDGKELYFTAMNRKGIPGPAIFRSLKKDGKWSEPELMISGMVGEPTLTADKNYLYFVHLITKGGKLVDAEIMFAKRKVK